MNDHVDKPFDVAQLVQVIPRHLGRKVVDSAVTPPPEPEIVGDGHGDPVLDAAREAGIEMAAALARLGGRRPVYMRLAASFLDDLGHLPGEIARCVAADARDDLVRALHTAKGVAATLGMAQLAAALRATEVAARERETDPLAKVSPSLLSSIDAEIELGLAALRTLTVTIERNTSRALASSTPVEPDELRRFLEHMVRLIEDNDLAVLGEARRLEQDFAGDAPGWFIELCSVVDAMDFDVAKRICEVQLKQLACAPAGTA